MRTSSVIAVLTMLTTQAVAHSGGLNKQGCHSGSQPYHCHKSAKVAPVASSDSAMLNGIDVGAPKTVDCYCWHFYLSSYMQPC